MARARIIKPGFFINEDLIEIEPRGRLLFIGLWLLADKKGRLEDRPRRIHGELFCYEECDVDGLLSRLAELGFIQRYEVASKRYIQILNFEKHQSPHPKEAASEIPDPTEQLQEPTTVEQEDSSLITRQSNVITRLSPSDPNSNSNSDPNSNSDHSSADAELPPEQAETSKEAALLENPEGDPFDFQAFIARALDYGDQYPNKEEACRHAKAAINSKIKPQELVKVAHYMLEDQFWEGKPIQIATLVKYLGAYRRAIKTGWQPDQKGQGNGRNGAHRRDSQKVAQRRAGGYDFSGVIEDVDS